MKEGRTGRKEGRKVKNGRKEGQTETDGRKEGRKAKVTELGVTHSFFFVKEGRKERRRVKEGTKERRSQNAEYEA